MSYPRARRAARRSAYAKTAAFHLKLRQALAYYPPNHRDAEILRFWDTLAPYGFLPLANARVRRTAATALIDALLAHYSRVCQDRSVRTFLVTFAWDAGLTPITEPVLDMEAMERLVRRQLERLGLNAICAFDLDVFSKPNDGEEVRHLHMHVHALCWTRDPAFRPHTTAAKLRKGRAFPNRIGAPSVKFRSRAESAAQFAAFDRACQKRVRAKPVTASPNIARDRSRRDQTALSIARRAAMRAGRLIGITGRCRQGSATGSRTERYRGTVTMSASPMWRCWPATTSASPGSSPSAATAQRFASSMLCSICSSVTAYRRTRQRWNRSPWPHAPRADYTEFRYLPRPDTAPRADNAFSLDYDFSKYPVERLCHVFACPGWQVEDQISAVVRRWDATVGGMYEGRGSDGIDRSWSSGYMPERDQYGGYLGWHALMLVAGDLLAMQPVVGEHWGGDAWMAFLDDYMVSRDDGLWLADLTDLFPLDLPKPDALAMPDSGEAASLAKDRLLLAPLLGVADDKLAADWLPVSARWSLDRDTTLTVRSLLADARDARSTVMTLLSDEPFFRWLPDDDDEIARHFGGAGHSVQEWVSATPNTERKLDRYDPYAASTALDRPFPADWVRAEQSIVADDAGVRSWSRDGSPAYHAEAWGAEGGVGEHAWSQTGYRLSIRRDALIERLASSGKSLVLALKLQKYHKHKSPHRDGDTSAFTHRSLILVANERGAVWLPQRLSRQARAALATLAPDSRPDFYHRFRAIAGLPDEWAARRAATHSFDGDAYRIIIEEPDFDL